MINMPGLKFVNLELTSRCNKNCWMCGRRKIEKERVVNWGDMPPLLARKIAKQIPEGTVVAFHNNGEPLLYPHLNMVLPSFKKHIRCLDTNGKLLVEKAKDIINNLETITISVIEKDTEGDEQYQIVQEFLKIKQDKKPRMIYRLLGEVTNAERWYKLPGLVATRMLHSPMGSFNYAKKVTIPEHGICIEALTHLAIDRSGYVSMCVRFDPDKKGVLGNVIETDLETLWKSKKRKEWIQKHIEGKRNEIPLCSTCEFWGIPKGD